MPTALDFDPYFVWLRVSAEDRPLNPYQLLGLNVFERDTTRIRDAAERKQTMLQIEKPTADPAVWQQVHTELETAAATLLDSQRKAVLDAAIKRHSKKLATRPPGGSNGANGATAYAAAAIIACRGCKKPNSAQRRFCAGCGQSLWEQCPKCDAECSADERFCGICGADIHGELAGQNAQYQALLEEAQRHAAGFRFEAALSALHGLAAIEDARFESWALQAVDEIARLQAEHQKHVGRAAKAVAKAQQLLAAHAYDAVLQTLAEVAEPLRTAELRDLWQQAQSARDEVLRLGGEIRAALEEKRTWDLLPKLERMLALRPNHAQVLQLATQLRDQFVKQAKKKLTEHKYAEAVQSLEQIPSSTRTEEIDALADKAQELASLLDAVRQAPLADKATLALAEKLVKIAAKNPEALALRQQLLERSKSPPADPRAPVADFAPPAQRSRLELPAVWLGNSLRLGGRGDQLPASLRDQAGQFFVALGLALQGIGQAAISFNLAPAEKSAVMGVLTLSLTGRRGPLTAWGLDLSDSGLKAIKLSYDAKTQTTKVEECEHIWHRTALNLPDAELQQGEICEATLQEFLSRHDLKDTKVCIGISGHRTLGRFIELPPMPAKKLAEVVPFEAKHQIPIPLEELRWAYQIQDPIAGKAADEQPRRIVIVATRESHVQDRLQTFKRAGIAVDVVQSECVALHNAAVFEFFSNPDPSQHDPVALVDVGAESTNMIVSTPRATWFRSFGVGGQSFTSALVKQFQLTYEQAEQLKRDPARARRYHLLRATTAPLLAQLSDEIERSLASYQKSHPGRKLRRLYGLGGGFEQHGLLRHLMSG